jgi:hypothetical protein
LSRNVLASIDTRRNTFYREDRYVLPWILL